LAAGEASTPPQLGADAHAVPTSPAPLTEAAVVASVSPVGATDLVAGVAAGGVAGDAAGAASTAALGLLEAFDARAKETKTTNNKSTRKKKKKKTTTKTAADEGEDSKKGAVVDGKEDVDKKRCLATVEVVYGSTWRRSVARRRRRPWRRR